jgi:hypothetical protein
MSGYLGGELQKGNFKKGHSGALDIYNRSSPSNSNRHIGKMDKSKSLWTERSRDIHDASIEKDKSKDRSKELSDDDLEKTEDMSPRQR